MKKCLSHFAIFCLSTLVVFTANAQNASSVSGTVKNASTSETVAAVSVTLKGNNSGTYTNDRGNFKLTVSQKTPYTLVFSSVGFTNKEVVVNDNTASLNVSLSPAFVLGSDVVVSASRVSEKFLESPVTIERISSANIRTAPASGYYDILGTLKGVDVIAASILFRSISTRGFNSSGNNRMNQLIDGMDNQLPGLNFSVSSVVGLTELDVDNIELLPGASSALYGSGGMNGTVLINSKNPFKYQGLSFQVKQGVNHVDESQRPRAPFVDYTVRWASTIGDRFAYKVSAQYTEAQDWLANNNSNYSRLIGNGNGGVIAGTRLSDPNYDGINLYGDETSLNINSGLIAPVKAGILAQLAGAYGAGASTVLAQLQGASAVYNTLAKYGAFLGASPATAGLVPYAAFLFGDAKGWYKDMNVSRTGYGEASVINPTAKNLKVTGSVHYKVNDKTEASLSAYTGSGNTVYTGSDRYSLRDFALSQLKFEVKSKNWMFRAYKTLEDAGNSFNATITTRLFNETWKPSATWYQQYTGAYTQYRDAGLDYTAANNAARVIADAGRPTGNIADNSLFKTIASTPISKNGGKFLDQSRLSVAEGTLNLTEVLKLNKYDIDWLVGGTSKLYTLNSQGTLFADTAGRIYISETGAFSQLSKKFFGDVLKLSFSGRYDKNTNFKGKFTPRFSAVVKLAEDNNIRLSYQNAYRFPTTQNQWINLLVGGGTRLMGGLPQLRDYYKFNTNPAYTLASVNAFGASAAAGAPNPALLKQQVFGEFKPESMNSFEIGYKTLIAKKLLVDFYAYSGRYENFISGVTVLQSRNAASPSPLDVLDAGKRIAYSISANATANVSTKGWGASVDYLLPNRFVFTANLFTDEIGELPKGFISYFNTPTWRSNFGLSHPGLLMNNRLGFNISLHYQDEVAYEGTFVAGLVPSYNTVDAVLTYKVPKIKSLVKIGGTNVMNKYYYTGFGSPGIGGLYYISFAYNVL
ncbi:MAG: TonB-dependent receptor [Chitinophagaceae bacterium]|nr:TonB-dependent receptor [Chitinophagaceae bacterium]